MAQSRPLSVGMDVHQASIAVADVAPAWGAAVVSLGTVGTRQGESAKRIRPLQSKSTQLVFVDAAGPCGSWLSRSLTTTGHGCWVVAPSLLPQKTGDRGTTARRDAMQGARLLRSGDRTPVSVPAVQDAAMRDLSRARAATRHALKTATVRLTALLRRHAIRSTGRAPWGPAPLRWRREVVGPPPPPSTSSAKPMAGRAPPGLPGASVWNRHATRRAPPGGSARSWTRCPPSVACRVRWLSRPWRHAATCPASRPPDHACRIEACRLRHLPVARADARAASRRPGRARPVCAAGRGLAPRPRSVGPCHSASQSSPSRSRTCGGRPRSACVNALGSAAPGGPPQQVVVALARALRALMGAMAQQGPVTA